ncbi:MAG: DUF21 domain-containing protein, partial [Lentimicrobiaceae bacterium]|nr:DUF21 domain-containing protein [Lentimicrobiaceae bacterium]
MVLLFFYLGFALIISFICSIMEAALLSVPFSFINMKELEGNKAAAVLKLLKENINKPLAAILSFNTVANVIGAAGVGAQAAIVLQNVPFGVISGILTLLLLVFSEIVPKTIGARFCKSIALHIVFPLK